MALLLLDTCALIDFARGGMVRQTIDHIDAHIREKDAYVSAFSALEVAQLCWASRLAIGAPPRDWFDLVIASTGLRITEFSEAEAFDAYDLPEPFHRDPADRVIVATARAMRAVLMTNDRRILTYGTAGHVLTIAY